MLPGFRHAHYFPSVVSRSTHPLFSVQQEGWSHLNLDDLSSQWSGGLNTQQHSREPMLQQSHFQWVSAVNVAESWDPVAHFHDGSIRLNSTLTLALRFSRLQDRISELENENQERDCALELFLECWQNKTESLKNRLTQCI